MYRNVGQWLPHRKYSMTKLVSFLPICIVRGHGFKPQERQKIHRKLVLKMDAFNSLQFFNHSFFTHVPQQVFRSLPLLANAKLYKSPTNSINLSVLPTLQSIESFYSSVHLGAEICLSSICNYSRWLNPNRA